MQRDGLGRWKCLPVSDSTPRVQPRGGLSSLEKEEHLFGTPRMRRREPSFVEGTIGGMTSSMEGEQGVDRPPDVYTGWTGSHRAYIWFGGSCFRFCGKDQGEPRRNEMKGGLNRNLLLDRRKGG